MTNITNQKCIWQNENIDIEVGSILRNHQRDELIVGKIHEWDDYFDLEIVNKTTDESGHLRVNKSIIRD